LAATQVAKGHERREQIRHDFPDATAGIDKLRAVFGPGVKPLYFEEDGKTMGKEQAFEGTDVDKLIRLSESDAKRGGR
jgi:hypothetical protein